MSQRPGRHGAESRSRRAAEHASERKSSSPRLHRPQGLSQTHPAHAVFRHRRVRLLWSPAHSRAWPFVVAKATQVCRRNRNQPGSGLRATALARSDHPTASGESAPSVILPPTSPTAIVWCGDTPVFQLEATQSPGTCQPASVLRMTGKNADFVRVTKLRGRRAGTVAWPRRRRYHRSLRYVVSLTHRLRLTPWLAVWRFAGKLQEMSPDSRAAQSASCSLPSARILLRPPGEAAIGRRSAMPYPK